MSVRSLLADSPLPTPPGQHSWGADTSLLGGTQEGRGQSAPSRDGWAVPSGISHFHLLEKWRKQRHRRGDAANPHGTLSTPGDWCCPRGPWAHQRGTAGPCARWLGQSSPVGWAGPRSGGAQLCSQHWLPKCQAWRAGRGRRAGCGPLHPPLGRQSHVRASGRKQAGRSPAASPRGEEGAPCPPVTSCPVPRFLPWTLE